MLTQFRNAFKGSFGKILGIFVVALTILAFAFVGVPDLRNFTRPSPLEVGGQKYSAQDVRDEFNRQLDVYRRQTGDYLTTAEAVDAGILERTLNTLILRAVVGEDTDTYNLTATNAMVRDYLQSEPAFADPTTGEFDQQRLAMILQQNSLSLEGFRNEIQAELIRNQLLNSLGAPAPAPKQWIRLLLKRQTESRTLSYVRIEPPADLAVEASEDQLRAYYEAHEEDYTAPEFRSFRAIILRGSEFAETLETSEEDLRQLFDSRRAALSDPETRTVRQLTFPGEAEAEAAATRLREGVPFEQLAEEQGHTLERVTYENVERDDLTDPAIADALFSVAEPGSVVGPVNGIFGYTVGEVLEITPAREASFEEQRETLRAGLLGGETSRLLYDAVEEIERARDTGASLDEAVEAVPEARLVSYGPVDRDLFTPQGSVLEDLPVSILNEAFLLEPGEESPVLELDEEELAEGEDGYFAVILDDVREPALRPFEEVRGTVTAAWQRERRRAATQERLAGLRQKISDGADLTAAAQELGLEATTVQLPGQGQDLPDPFVQEVYDARLDNLVSAWGENGTVAYAGIVRDVTFRSLPNEEEQLDIYASAAGQQLSSELTDAYLLAARGQTDIRRDNAQLARLFEIGQE